MPPAGNLDILKDLPLQRLRYSVAWSSSIAACTAPCAPADAASTEQGSWVRSVMSDAMQQIGMRLVGQRSYARHAHHMHCLCKIRVHGTHAAWIRVLTQQCT